MITDYAGGGIGLGPRPEPDPATPYPAPEITSEDGVAGPDKRAVVAMCKLAQDYGWTVRVTYARGCYPHASTGRPGPQRDSLAVRMARGPERAVAVYRSGSTWSWDTLWHWITGQWPTRFGEVTPFQDVLRRDRPLT